MNLGLTISLASILFTWLLFGQKDISLFAAIFVTACLINWALAELRISVRDERIKQLEERIQDDLLEKKAKLAGYEFSA